MNQEILRRLHEAAAFVTNKGYRPVYIALFGSQNYGLDVHNEEYQSDFDYKCIVLPTLADLVKNANPASVVLDYEGGHIDVKDIREYMKTLRRANPAYIEPLITQYALSLNEGEKYMPQIRSKVVDLVSQEGYVFTNACKGLFYEKRNKMTHPYPTKIDLIAKYGYDGKQVCHMLRMLLMLKAFVATGRCKLEPPQEYIRQLIDLKLNLYTLDEAVAMANGWIVELEHVSEVLETIYKKADLDFEAAEQMNAYAQQIVFDFCQTELGKGTLNKGETNESLSQ